MALLQGREMFLDRGKYLAPLNGQPGYPNQAVGNSTHGGHDHYWLAVTVPQDECRGLRDTLTVGKRASAKLHHYHAKLSNYS
jgi:hypothetical protein